MPLFQITHTLTRPDGCLNLPALRAYAVRRQNELVPVGDGSFRPLGYDAAYNEAISAGQFEREQNADFARRNEAYQQQEAALRQRAHWLTQNHSLASLRFKRNYAFGGNGAHRENNIRAIDMAIALCEQTKMAEVA